MKLPDASMSLLVKLGSIAVHVEEFLSNDGNAFDKHTLESLLQDAEVREWLAGMNVLSLLPLKRKGK